MDWCGLCSYWEEIVGCLSIAKNDSPGVMVLKHWNLCRGCAVRVRRQIREVKRKVCVSSL